MRSFAQAAEGAGMSIAEIEDTLKISNDTEVKNELKETTAEANALGVSNLLLF